ncbi:MAG: hypothetical protein FRX49_00987 [Trebouxia sp. A1-2]|nr:MAG: hypothetical protein FRX49_00987 [Trebouxia sp. A1-2]
MSFDPVTKARWGTALVKRSLTKGWEPVDMPLNTWASPPDLTRSLSGPGLNQDSVARPWAVEAGKQCMETGLVLACDLILLAEVHPVCVANWQEGFYEPEPGLSAALLPSHTSLTGTVNKEEYLQHGQRKGHLHALHQRGVKMSGGRESAMGRKLKMPPPPLLTNTTVKAACKSPVVHRMLAAVVMISMTKLTGPGSTHRPAAKPAAVLRTPSIPLAPLLDPTATPTPTSKTPWHGLVLELWTLAGVYEVLAWAFEACRCQHTVNSKTPERASATTGHPRTLLMFRAAMTSSDDVNSATTSSPLSAERRVAIRSAMPGEPASMPLGLASLMGLEKGALELSH